MSGVEEGVDERGIYGVLPIGQSQTVLKMAKGSDQRILQAAAL